MSGGMLPVSTAASVGTPSGIPTDPDCMTPEHLWECSRLMRHAQISTTMNVYGNALMEAKREANAAVVSSIFEGFITL
jgi:hypothetical protein